MRRIEKYIASLSRRVALRPREMKEFKDEIRSHLNESVQALRREGSSEEERLTIAIRRFGEEKALNSEFRRLYRRPGSFKKPLLFAACLFLVLSLLFTVCGQSMERREALSFDRMLHDFHRNVEGKLADNELSDTAIQAFYEKHKRILRFVYVPKSDVSPEYVYPAATAGAALNVQPYLTFPVAWEDRGVQPEIRIALDKTALFSPLPRLALTGAAVCFGLYWILYALWSMINAHRSGRLNLFWAMLFCTLNFAAYLAFKRVERIGWGRYEAAV